MVIQEKLERLLKSIPASSSETNRWDKEWISYFNTENPRPFLLDLSNLKPSVDILTIQKSSEQEILNLNLVQELPALNIWVRGSDLVNKQVLEIGCGPGLVGKQLGSFVKHYLGIDYSELALSIAQLVSPQNCDYVHLSESNRLLEYAESRDTMISRFFFIHQNFDNALWILKLAKFLLKPNGIVSADFYQANPEIPQGLVFPAKHSLSRDYPSCGFEFTEVEIQELATESGFKIANMTKDTLMQRLFVRFEKQG
jgi:SAM-dependent methyltransferase